MGKKTFMAAIIITVFLISLPVGMQAVDVAKANPIPYPPTPNKDEPNLQVQNPQNFTSYSLEDTTTITLNFTITKPISWNLTQPNFGFPAIGKIQTVNATQNDRLIFNDFLGADFLNGTGEWSKEYSVNLNDFNLGLNKIEVSVYAMTFSTPDYYVETAVKTYPMYVTDTIYLNFTDSSPVPAVTLVPSLSPSLSPIPTPSLIESPTQQPTHTQPTQTATTLAPSFSPEPYSLIVDIAAILIVILAVAILLAVYLRRTKKQKKND